MTSGTFLATALALCLTMSACAHRAEEELSAAERALEAARRAEAPSYAPDAYVRAERALRAAREEVRAQADKGGFERSFDHALVLIARAKAAGREAVTQSLWNQDDARLETAWLLQEARAEIAAAQRALEEPPAIGPVPPSLANEVERAESGLWEAERAFQERRYDEAFEMARRAKAFADDLSASTRGAGVLVP